MNRGDFLTGGLSLVGGLVLPGRAAADTRPSPPVLVPPPLKAGDTVGITSPAGYVRPEEVQPAVSVLQSWGFKVRLGDTVGMRDCSFGGTDAQRAADLQRLIDAPEVAAVLCARGGYGATRMVDMLNLEPLLRRPKWVIGFSDITALHLHIDARLSMVGIHSKMCNSFPSEWELADPLQKDTILSIREALTGRRMRYETMPHPSNRTGSGEGRLVGGNLSVIQNCMATPSEIRTEGRILFLEETGEYPYSIDRMLTNLGRAGKLGGLQGLVIGGFTRIRPDDPGEEFGRTVEEMVMEKVAAYGYPVCFGFPVGHQKNNMALKCGAAHRLEVDGYGGRLSEL